MVLFAKTMLLTVFKTTSVNIILCNQLPLAMVQAMLK